MSKPKFKLRLVPAERPLGPLTRAEKLANAIGWLRSRNRYILDAGAVKPTWGRPKEVPPDLNRPLMEQIMEADRRRKK